MLDKLPLQNTCTQLQKTHNGPVYVVKFNGSGEYCMSGSEDRSVCLYNPKKKMMIKHYKNVHNYDISGLDIGKDNSKFVTSGGDRHIIITDVVEGKCVRRYTGHNNRVNSVAFNLDNSLIISGSYDTTAKIWDNRANSHHPVDTIKGFKDSVSHAEIEGHQIICSSMDGTTRFYDVRTGQFTCDSIGEAIQSMSLAHSGRAYIVSALNNSIYLIERKNGNKIMEYRGHSIKDYNIHCRFDEGDSHIYTGSANGKLVIYDLMKSTPNRQVQVSNNPLSALDLNPQGGLIAADHNGSLFYWSL